MQLTRRIPFMALLLALCALGRGARAQDVSGADTTAAGSTEAGTRRPVYWGEALGRLLARTGALIEEGFGAAEQGRIAAEALQLRPRGLFDPQMPPARNSYVHQVRFRGRAAELHVQVVKAHIGFVDVRFRTADTALAAALRGAIESDYLASLAPVGGVRMAVRESRGANGITPWIVLLMRTERQFSCLGYILAHTFERHADTLSVRLRGIDGPGHSLCLTAMGPATLSMELTLEPGRYPLRVDAAGEEARFVLTVTDSSLSLAATQVGFVVADERLHWRHPRSSFALHCSEAAVASGPCRDMERWLLRQPGITRLTHGSHGISPYVHEAEDWTQPLLVEPAPLLFRYADDQLLGSVRSCLASVSERIRMTVGVSLHFETWMGERMHAGSTRSNHERHDPVPATVTGGPGCTP